MPAYFNRLSVYFSHDINHQWSFSFWRQPARDELTSAFIILLLLLQGAGLSELPDHGAVLAWGQPVEAEEGGGREADVEEAEAAGAGQHGPREEVDEGTEDASNNIQRDLPDPERSEQRPASSKRNDSLKWKQRVQSIAIKSHHLNPDHEPYFWSRYKSFDCFTLQSLEYEAKYCSSVSTLPRQNFERTENPYSYSYVHYDHY